MEKRLSEAGTDTAEILCEIRNHIAVITLNRPSALNALSFGMLGELRTLLRRCAAEAKAERPAQPATAARIAAMQGFLEDLHEWYGQIKKLPPASLRSLLSLGSGITRLLPKVRRRRLD